MLVAILFLLKSEEEKTKSRPPNILYEVVLTWDGESGDDLDIYVKSASGHIVSFNNREGGDGSLISLDHDALGKRNNSLGEGVEGTIVKFHEERVSFRGITDGENVVISGQLDIANGSDAVTGVNTRFTTELKIGDSISFTNDSGTTEIKRIEAIISDNSLTLGSNVAAASTKTVATRRRAKLQDSNKNISI